MKAISPGPTQGAETVLVTGISGFIGKHLALELLRQGYQVRGTVRDLGRAEAIRRTLADHGADVSALSFVEADLASDAGWREALQGCSFVHHVASPFPIEQPRDREALVPAARQGTLRVLNAALEADVRRIVLTSSMVAMMHRPGQKGLIRVEESDWTDADWKGVSPYIVSKTRAEQAAWEWAAAKGWEQRLSVINPGFVLGPSLDGSTNTSLKVIQLIMRGAYPAVPPVHYPVVDVRDLVAIHIRAMQQPEAAGRRLIAAGETMSMAAMSATLREAFPERARKAPTRVLPPLIVRLLSIFDRSLKSVLADMKLLPQPVNAYVQAMTGVGFRPAAESVRASGQSLIDHGSL